MRQITNLPQLRTSATTGANLLTAGGELGDGTCGSGLRALSAGVGVHLGVDDDDVDILAAGQDVVEAAESDIIAPAVAAEDTLAVLGPVVLVGEFAFVIKR